MRKIIITGGSRGIGAALVESFSAQGDRVAFIYRADDAAAKKITDSCGAIAIRADISDAQAANAAIERAIEELSGVDVLVNCAGVAQIKLFCDLTDADWRKMIDTDLSGAFYACRAASRVMIREKKGKIINIGSVWGRVGASCEVHYSAAKAGLRGMTFALAKELGPSGITVNCIEPGVIDTQMNSTLSSEDLATLSSDTPMGRIGKPSEVAELAYFLASDSASFITGQAIGIDGGFAI